MELAVMNKLFGSKTKDSKAKLVKPQNLTDAKINHSYLIKGVDTKDKPMKDFMFTLGCFEGEKVTVISVLADNYIINVKDARYSIDKDLAKAILI